MMAKGLSNKQIVERLKVIDLLTDDLKLTRRGKEYADGILKQMNNVERIMVERFILEHHKVDIDINYSEPGEELMGLGEKEIMKLMHD